jgi:Asp-tRNA(Asn)/Glu-tRNA(Gln) amidotransferase A subunit family amidase
MGRPFDEETLFSAAHAYEQSAAWFLRKPEVAA